MTDCPGRRGAVRRRPAFALPEGEVSRPIVSPFGVHLIRCCEVKPGDKSWEDVRQQLETAAAAELFQSLAEQERPQATVVFTGAAPYFRPGARQLVDTEPHAEP